MFAFLRKLSLVHWILISMVLGTLVGWLWPDRIYPGTVTSASANAAELVVAVEGRDLTLQREAEPKAGATWLGTDANGEPVKVTVERSGPPEPKAGDKVKVAYQTFAASHLKPLSTLFLRMIQSLIAPLLFATLVIGIAGHGDDMKRVGRLALRSLIYFEIVTTLALAIGLVAVNLVQPGVGVTLPPPSPDEQKAIDKFKTDDPNKDAGILTHILDHMVPKSFIQAAASNEVLQIVFWSILFAVGLTQVRGKPKEAVIGFLEGLAEVMFKFTGIVMLYAPIGIGVAMAVTVGHSGLSVLVNLGLLILTLYGALVVFMLVVLLPAALWARVPLRKFGKAIKEPALLAFATTSSEAALPKAMLAMEAIGVPRRIVAFVMPTGYSFNLDGTTLYLAIATIFAFQAGQSLGPPFDQPLSWADQLVIMFTLMLTSKGVAAVPRASLVILTGTLASFRPELLPAVALILGVDELMDMARTTVNLIGNCLATCVMARWEGEFDDNATGVEPGATDAPEAPAETPATS